MKGIVSENDAFPFALVGQRSRKTAQMLCQSPSYWTQITDNKKGTGQPNVNGTKLANLVVPIAPPEEQKEIVAYLDDLQARVNAVKRLQAETQAELDALLPSILDKAFRGEPV